jgi:Flp pilus assembly protein TadD
VAAAGAACVAFAGLRRIRARLGIAAVAAGGFALVALGPRWDVELLAGGAYKYAPFLAGLDIESALHAGELLFHADGAAGTVTVRQAAGTRTLAIDGKIDASNGGDMLTQKLLGHLPLLLHQDPKAICVIGLGSGVTAGSVLRHPVTRVDVLEISPAVVEASEFFRVENGEPLADGRTRLIVGDGRTHLAFTSSAYDVVISEPSNPWMAGMAGLFTREFFEIVRRRLEPGGIFCQWAHAYDMSDADLRSIVATFISVFPRTTLWLSGDSDILLVGTDHEIEGRLPGLGARLSRAEVAGDLARVQVRDSFSLVSLYTAGAAALRGYARNAALQTDDRLALEHTAPLALFQNEGPENLERLLALAGESGRPPEVRRGLANATADGWWNRGRMLDQAEAHGLAFDSYRLAIGREPAHAGALEGLVRAAGAAGRTDEAPEVLREVGDEHPDNVPARLALSRLLAASGSTDAAMNAARQARALAPESPEVLEQHASLCADSGDLVSLQALVKEMQARHPDRAGTHYFAANALFMAGDYAQAAGQSLAAVAADSRYARAWTVAGAAHAILGQADEARAAFRTSLAIDPADATAWANFALLELNTGNAGRAARLFAEALTVDPRQPVAREGLAEALERQGYGTRAARIRGFNSRGAGSQR